MGSPAAWFDRLRAYRISNNHQVNQLKNDLPVMVVILAIHLMRFNPGEKSGSIESTQLYKGLTQIFRNEIGSLGSPCACNLIGAAPCGSYFGCPMYSVLPFKETLF